MNPFDAVLKRVVSAKSGRISGAIIATATAGVLFFSPSLTTMAAPGSHVYAPGALYEQTIVPRENDDDVAEPSEDNGDTVVITYGSGQGEDEDDDTSGADGQESGDQQPLRLTGIMNSRVDLSHNQWTGAMDGRLVEPFAVAPQPERLISDAIGLNAPITVREIVGGQMQTPKDENEVTWYKETASAGEDGNMVFAGHLNWYGVPQAVFYNINQLKKGDTIEVTGENGEVFTYRVKWVKLIETADADMDKLVGPTKKPSLTLITCGGEWDPAAAQYKQRTVVRAELEIGK